MKVRTLGIVIPLNSRFVGRLGDPETPYLRKLFFKFKDYSKDSDHSDHTELFRMLPSRLIYRAYYIKDLGDGRVLKSRFTTPNCAKEKKWDDILMDERTVTLDRYTLTDQRWFNGVSWGIQ